MSKNRYTVIGPVAVRGTAPGDDFEAELDPAQELRLIQGGHIRLADGSGDAPDTPAGARAPRKPRSSGTPRKPRQPKNGGGS